MDPVSSAKPVQAEDPVITSMKECGKNVASMVKPAYDKGNKIVSDATTSLFGVKNCPEDATRKEKIANRIREAFATLGKLTLVVSGVYILAISISVIKVVLVTALLILGLSYIAKNEKIINRISETADSIISKFTKAPATAGATEVKADATKINATKVDVKADDQNVNINIVPSSVSPVKADILEKSESLKI